jgi:hypothetical protein
MREHAERDDGVERSVRRERCIRDRILDIGLDDPTRVVPECREALPARLDRLIARIDGRDLKAKAHEQRKSIAPADADFEEARCARVDERVRDALESEVVRRVALPEVMKGLVLAGKLLPEQVCVQWTRLPKPATPHASDATEC